MQFYRYRNEFRCIQQTKRKWKCRKEKPKIQKNLIRRTQTIYRLYLYSIHLVLFKFILSISLSTSRKRLIESFLLFFFHFDSLLLLFICFICLVVDAFFFISVNGMLFNSGFNERETLSTKTLSYIRYVNCKN